MAGDDVDRWMDELQRVVTELLEGLSEEELGTIIDAMNEEFIEAETSDND